jgi:hypothetical protein
MSETGEQQGMHKRRITLADGRYLIFYTFDDSPAPQAETEGSRRRAPEPQAQAEEERRV